MMLLDTALMHKDILKKLYAIEKPQRYLTEKLKISRSTLFRMSHNKELTMTTFLILITWLDECPSRYIKPKQRKK
jgi:hypothetical protein